MCVVADYMLKYHSSYIGFREIPDEISLCINISNCPNNCKGCHSPWLKEDVGEDLNIESLNTLINKNKGVSCICFMGGDQDFTEVSNLATIVKMRSDCPYKTAWYSGRQHIPNELDINAFDYIKVGPYIEELGGLDNINTNQRLYMIYPNYFGNIQIDITNKFWNDN